MYGDHGYLDFTKLWEFIEKKGKNKQFLLNNGLHKGTIYHLVRNESVSAGTIASLCYLLDAKPNQIMEYVPPTKGETE